MSLLQKPCDSVKILLNKVLWTPNDIYGCVRCFILLDFTRNY